MLQNNFLDEAIADLFNNYGYDCISLPIIKMTLMKIGINWLHDEPEIKNFLQLFFFNDNTYRIYDGYHYEITMRYHLLCVTRLSLSTCRA